MEGVLGAPDSTAARPGLRLRVTAVVVAALFAVLALRLWTLQVIQAPAAAQAVAANQIRTVPIPSTRGEILDRTGVPLVNNAVVQEITLSQTSATGHPGVVGRLAALIGETSKQVNASITNKANSPFQPIPILSGAPISDVLYIKEHASEFPGVNVTQTTERRFPQQSLPAAVGAYPAAQVLGYVGPSTAGYSASAVASMKANGYQPGDQVGQNGLEYQYQADLQGKDGKQELSVDAAGTVVGTKKTVAGTSGDNLVTNIDLGLQQTVDADLASQIAIDRKTFDKASGFYPPAINGAVVVMDPRSGAVLAMSSFPSYNPSIWSGGISSAAYANLTASGAETNNAIDAQLAPGSTFKLAAATTALQNGLITPSTLFDDTGSYTAPGCTGPNCTLHDNIGDTPLGYIDVSTALVVSSDAFFYNLGATYWDDYKTSGQYGQQPIEDTAAQYGFGQPSGIDLPNEQIGRVDSPAERLKLHKESPVGFPTTAWYTGDNMEMAFGQGATVVTPLQEAVAYSTFANGGTRYAPEVAAGVIDPTGKVVKTVAPRVIGHVAISPSSYNAMLSGFEGVIQSPMGTGYGDFVGAGWNQSGFALGGKTGTASVNGTKGAANEPTSWFVGFGPNPNPQYVVVSMIDEGGYGVTASGEVVRQIFDYLRAHPVGPANFNPSSAVMGATQAAPLPGAPAPTTSTTTTTSPTTGRTSTPTATTPTTTTSTTSTSAG